MFSWLEENLQTGDTGDISGSNWIPARDLKIWGTHANPEAQLRYDALGTAPVLADANDIKLEARELDPERNKLNVVYVDTGTVSDGNAPEPSWYATA